MHASNKVPVLSLKDFKIVLTPFCSPHFKYELSLSS